MKKERTGYFAALITSLISIGTCTYCIFLTMCDLIDKFMELFSTESLFDFIVNNYIMILGYFVTISVLFAAFFAAFDTFVRFVKMGRRLNKVAGTNDVDNAVRNKNENFGDVELYIEKRDDANIVPETVKTETEGSEKEWLDENKRQRRRTRTFDADEKDANTDCSEAYESRSSIVMAREGKNPNENGFE